MKIAIGADHAGFELAQHLGRVLATAGHQVLDLGPSSAARVDYPDYAHAVAKAIASGEVDRGVLVCGTGVGMAITANRHGAVRAVACDDLFTVRLARQHNDANCLALGARIVAPPLAEALVEEFLAVPFEGGRHAARIAKTVL